MMHGHDGDGKTTGYEYTHVRIKMTKNPMTDDIEKLTEKLTEMDDKGWEYVSPILAGGITVGAILRRPDE